MGELTNKGKGRPKGSPNKATASLKEAILSTLDKAGGIEYLYKVSQSDYKTFCSLLGRVLPMQVTGENGGPLQISVVKFSGDKDGMESKDN